MNIINFKRLTLLSVLIYVFQYFFSESINYVVVASPLIFYFAASWIAMKLTIKAINLSIKNGVYVLDPEKAKEFFKK